MYHCKWGIAYSQALRIVQVCSELENCLLVQQVQELKGFLINQGYDEEEVQAQIEKAAMSSRQGLHVVQLKQTKTILDQTVLMHGDLHVASYHLGLSPLEGILKKHLCILRQSSRLSSAVQNPPLVVYRRPNLLLHTQLSESLCHHAKENAIVA